jgi:hypothetical protein
MELKYFEMPPDVMEASVCSETGLLANETCPSYPDLILKKNASRRCSMEHTAETSPVESKNDPPPGSIGF